MECLKDKIDELFIRGKIVKDNFFSEERGDTNFISIAIILVIVCIVAVAVFAFKDRVINVFKNQTETFFDEFEE